MDPEINWPAILMGEIKAGQALRATQMATNEALVTTIEQLQDQVTQLQFGFTLIIEQLSKRIDALESR